LNADQFGAIISPGDAGEARVIVLFHNWTRWLLAAVAMLLPATLLHAALPTETNIPDRVFLAGQLLIAAPQLRQPAFDHAVILLAQHSREGALGIVINRPVDERPIARLLSALGADATGITDSVRVFVGGPVDSAVGFVLHSADYHRSDTLDIDGRVALTGAAGVLRDIGLGKGPQKALVAFGYAGWAPSQLENELAHGVWVTVPEDVNLVFDDDRAKVWADALTLHKTLR
jgi:putative transcriptional regulator